METQTCVDCRTTSPETDTNYTLISAQYGWRLHRKRTPDGQFVMEWRCPACWSEFKRATGAMSSPDLAAHAGEHRTPRTFFERASRRLRGRNSEPPDQR